MKKNFSMPLKTILVLYLVFLVCACAGKKPVSPPAGQEAPELLDLRKFPQDLFAYSKTQPARRLISETDQLTLTDSFLDVYFGPWQMRKTTVPLRDVAPFFKKARGYKNGQERWSQPEWDEMKANANLGNFPSRATPGITLRMTDLRELPTHTPRFSEPVADIQANPFDYFQYSLLWPGMPLLIAHTTRDGRWHYIECPIAAGWVDAKDIAIAGESFQAEYRSGKFAALTRERVTLPGIGLNGADGQGGIGTILPLVSNASNGNLAVLVPFANKQGHAETAEITLAQSDAAIMPLALTASNVAKIGNAMMGQPYGWGGTNKERDCSAMMRDLFTPFGLWLPRNSAAQAKRGKRISLAGLSLPEKERMILEKGIPFLSLLGLPGHIGLYVGQWEGRPAMFHNAWGIRVVKDGNDNERYIIGKAVVTSISPGAELENLYRPVTFADRIRTLTQTGERNR